MSTAQTPGITLLPVRSSNIEAAGYDEGSKTLTVRFKGKPDIYQYTKVPPERWAQFKSTFDSDVSTGGYFHRYIRDKFPVAQIPPAPIDLAKS